MRCYIASLLASTLLLALSGRSDAQTALGNAGELYHTRPGLYRELFPHGHDDVAGGAPVLALEVARGGQVERLLVPGTEGAAVEAQASVVVEPQSGRAFVLWLAQRDGAGDALYLIGYGAEQGFSPGIEVSGDPTTLKGPPRLAVTRDSYGPDAIRRTVAHVIWREQGDAENVLYAPIVLVDGQYLGWNPVLRLDTYDSSPAVDPVPAGGWFRATAIEPGAEGGVVVGLPLRRSNRWLTLRIRVLPYVLLDLANDARSHIVVVGHRSTEGSILSLAEQARSHIIAVGATFHPGVAGYIADEGYREILAQGADFDEATLQEIAERLWERVIASGASILGNELDALASACDVLNLGGSPEEHPEEVRHQLEVCLVSSREAPAGVEGDGVSLLLSADGSRAVVAWLVDQALRYVESEGAGWSAVRETRLGGETDLAGALEMLRTLVRPQ